MIEGFAGWLVPHVFRSKDEAERHAVFQCSATRPVLNAVAAGMGMTLLPCYAGDADPRVLRASGTFDHLDLELWVLTHPDLRGTARVRALMSHIEDELRALADLFGGLRVSGADVEAP
jgi:DNA-binding transcriptional LysR family regulator